MKITKQGAFLNLSVLLMFLFSGILIAQNQISNSVISSGGERQLNANYVITGTLGQVSTDLTASTNYQVQSGFWYMYYQNVITSVDDQKEIIPTVFKLEQNYPNPFNPSTMIRFAVPERNNVLIRIYDILGGEVLTLANEELEAGWYERKFDATSLSTGVYICRMQADSYVSTKKMLMVK